MIIDDEGVEVPIVFKARAGSHRITLKRNLIDPPTIIHPLSISSARALDQMRRHPAYEKLRSQMGLPVQNAVLDGHKTRLHTLRFHENRVGERFAAYERGEFVDVYLPSGAEVQSHAVQRFLFQVLKGVVRAEGERILPPLVAQRAAMFGLKYSSVAVKQLANAWGKCRCDGYIVFSSALLFYPDNYVCMVVDHELTHLTYLDHSPAFWQLLSRYRGCDARQEDRAMHSYKLPLPTVY